MWGMLCYNYWLAGGSCAWKRVAVPDRGVSVPDRGLLYLTWGSCVWKKVDVPAKG